MRSPREPSRYPTGSKHRGLLALHRLLVDGGLVCLVFTVAVVATVWWNPWLWLDDYPPDIRAMVAGRVPEVPVHQQVIVALGVLLAPLILIVRSTAGGLRAESRRRGRFWRTFAHAFVLYQLVNLWDVLIVDWLIFATFNPAFVVLPGTEGAAGYSDYLFHLSASYATPTPWIGSVVLGLLVAAIAVGWVRASPGDRPGLSGVLPDD